MFFSTQLSHGLGPLGSLSSLFVPCTRESLSEQAQNGLEKHMSPPSAGFIKKHTYLQVLLISFKIVVFMIFSDFDWRFL